MSSNVDFSIDHGDSRKDWAIWGSFLCAFLIVGGVIVGCIKHRYEKHRNKEDEQEKEVKLAVQK